MGGTWLPITFLRIIGVSTNASFVSGDLRRVFICLDKLQGVFVFAVTMWTEQYRNSLLSLVSPVFGALFVTNNTGPSSQNENSGSTDQNTSSTNVSSTAV
jgi:hypothetical protein